MERMHFCRITNFSCAVDLYDPAINDAMITVVEARHLVEATKAGAAVSADEYNRLVFKVAKLEAEKKEMEADMGKAMRLIEAWL